MVIERSEQEIIPIMPTEEMSRLLNISQTKPILRKSIAWIFELMVGYLNIAATFQYR